MLIEAGEHLSIIIPVPGNFPRLVFSTSISLLKLLLCCALPLLNRVGNLKEFSVAKCCLWPF